MSDKSGKRKVKADEYPREVPERYEVRTGKWGQYFYDKERNCDLPLSDVLRRLELYELRKAQLRWYVKTYGENQ